MRHKFDAGLLLSGIPLCVLSRAVNIFPLAALINLGRKYPLPLNLQVCVGGCMCMAVLCCAKIHTFIPTKCFHQQAMQLATGLRGAVAYGLVIQIKNDAIETATLFIVVVTTLVLGGLTGMWRVLLHVEAVLCVLSCVRTFCTMHTHAGCTHSLQHLSGPLLRFLKLEGKDDAELLLVNDRCVVMGLH